MLGNKFKKIGLSIFSIFISSSIISCSNPKSDRSTADKNTAVEQNASNEGSQFELKSSHSKVQTIKWYSFEEGIKKAKLEKKYIFVDFYTDWCMYCKKLESETYTDEKVFNYINDKFIPIKVNAESHTKLTFNGKRVTEQELARQFEVNSYPTLFFLSGEKEAIGTVPGFVDAEQLFTLANYVATDAYKHKTLEQFKSARKI